MFQFYQTSFSRAKKLGLGTKIALGAVLFPILLASIPFIIFMLYRAAKLSKEIQKAQSEPETIRIHGDIIDIPSSRINRVK